MCEAYEAYSIGKAVTSRLVISVVPIVFSTLPSPLSHIPAPLSIDGDRWDGGEEGGGGDDGGAVEAAGRGVLRRVGKIQYRYPKVDHADCPLPDSVDWFIFPNGIAPIAQPTARQVRWQDTRCYRTGSWCSLTVSFYSFYVSLQVLVSSNYNEITTPSLPM